MHAQPAKSKSTGPRTESGKRTSSQNALRHGLASHTIVMPGEDPAEYAALQQSLHSQYQPASPTETLLVQDMAKFHWLMDRAIRLQGEALARASPGELAPAFPVLLRYQTTNERAFHRSLNILAALQKQRIASQHHFVSQQQDPATHSRVHSPLPSIWKVKKQREEGEEQREHAAEVQRQTAAASNHG